MEKELHPDSMTTVTIKPEYPPSEIYSSEPPPAYARTQSSVVQVAKIVAVTMVLVSIILGGFILASAYITATASCKQMEQDMEMLNDVIDRLQLPSSPEALVQAEALPLKSNIDALQRDDLEQDATKTVDNNVDLNEPKKSDDERARNDDSTQESEDNIPILIKLPLQLDFDDIAGALLEKNQKSRMNCVVEKKRSIERIDHKPRTLNLPFGINITTDPRQEHLSGERMAIFCESGNMQKQVPSDEDQDEESIMIQPVMVPIPPSSTSRHMPTTVQLPSLDTVRVPIPLQEHQNQLLPNHILHDIAQQIIARNIVDAQAALREQNQNIMSTPHNQQQHPLHKQNIPIPAEILSQLDRLPNHDVIVTVTQQEYDELPEDLQRMSPDGQELRDISQNLKNIPQQMNAILPETHSVPQHLSNMPTRFPTNPFLRELRSFSSEMEATPEIIRGTSQQEQGIRLLPVKVPLEMHRQEKHEVRSKSSEESRESRPHYVQPRSVRSVDSTLLKASKRVKRCSCDCAC